MWDSLRNSRTKISFDIYIQVYSQTYITPSPLSCIATRDSDREWVEGRSLYASGARNKF